MSKRMKKLLCCGVVLTELLPMANTALTANAKSSYKYRTSYVASRLPEYMRTNLNDYYGKNNWHFSVNTAKRKARRFEQLWHDFNNNKNIQKAYGHVGKLAYATRLHNEYVLSSSAQTGKNTGSIRFYGWLNKSLSRQQKQAIRNGRPVANLTKTQRSLLGKYGITNQMLIRQNQDNVASGMYNSIRIPAAAHLSNSQKYNLQHNLRIDGLSGHQLKVLKNYGLPAINGQNIEAGYFMNLPSSERNEPNPSSTPNQLNNVIKQNSGTQMPHYIYAVVIAPNGSETFARFNTHNPSGMKKLAQQISKSGGQIRMDNKDEKDNKSLDGLSSQEKTDKIAMDNLPDYYNITKDKNGNPYFDDIINGQPTKFTLHGNHWSADNISGDDLTGYDANDDPAVQDLWKNSKYANGNDTGDLDMPSDQAPSDGTPSDSSDNQPSDTTPSDSGVPNISSANNAAHKAKEAAEQAAQAKQAALDRARQVASQLPKADHPKAKESLQQQKNNDLEKARQDAANIHIDNHNATADHKDGNDMQSAVDRARQEAQDIKIDTNINKKTANSDQQTAMNDAEAVAVNEPGLTHPEAVKAIHYFKKNPTKLTEPKKVHNKSAKKMLRIATLMPEAATSTKDPKHSAHKQSKQNKNATPKTRKHNKSTAYTNNGLSAYDMQKIHQLYQQIQQIENNAKNAKHKSASVESIENIPDDGYIPLRQAYGDYAITSVPDDLAGSRDVVPTSIIKKANAKPGTPSKFWIANQVAHTSDGQKYYHVMSMNGMISGWINAKGVLTTKVRKSKLLSTGTYPIVHIIGHRQSKALNPDFVDAYEGVVQQYINGNPDLQHLVHHKFNKHQIPLARMYSPKDLKSKDKALDNIATKFQELVRIKMQIPQFSNQARHMSNLQLR